MKNLKAVAKKADGRTMLTAIVGSSSIAGKVMADPEEIGETDPPTTYRNLTTQR